MSNTNAPPATQDSGPSREPLLPEANGFSQNERCVPHLNPESTSRDTITRLIDALNTGFQTLLEGLRPKVEVTDAKTAFWNAYKMVADDHDKELHDIYNSDLDASIIFVRMTFSSRNS
jgi:hypothetical protein